MRSCSYCGVVAVCSHLVYLDRLRSVNVAAGVDVVAGLAPTVPSGKSAPDAQSAATPASGSGCRNGAAS